MKLINKLLALLLLLAISCAPTPPPNQDIWKDTQTIYFNNENITFKIPNAFKRSSKYVLDKDLPNLKNDSLKIITMKNALIDLEFNDAEIDIFVDTTQRYRFVVMMNTIKFMSFDREDGIELKDLFHEGHQRFELQNIGYRITELDSKIAGNEKMKMLKFKYLIENVFSGTQLYKSVYVLFQKGQTVIVHEHCESEDEIGAWLWSYRM